MKSEQKEDNKELVGKMKLEREGIIFSLSRSIPHTAG